MMTDDEIIEASLIIAEVMVAISKEIAHFGSEDKEEVYVQISHQCLLMSKELWRSRQ